MTKNKYILSGSFTLDLKQCQDEITAIRIMESMLHGIKSTMRHEIYEHYRIGYKLPDYIRRSRG